MEIETFVVEADEFDASCLHVRGAVGQGRWLIWVSQKGIEGIRIDHGHGVSARLFAVGEQLVLVEDQEAWIVQSSQVVKPLPVVPVRSIALSPDYVILVDDTDIVVVDSKGEWATGRVAYDGIRKIAVQDQFLKADGYSSAETAWLQIIVDLEKREVKSKAFP